MAFRKHSKKIYQSVSVLAGSLFLLLGVIGIFLPLLPTTPFLILAAVLFDQGSPRFHHWLLHHPLLGPPIIDWKKNRVIRTKYKILATVMLVISVVTIFLKELIPFAGKCVFIVFIAGILIFIWTRKSNHS